MNHKYIVTLTEDERKMLTVSNLKLDDVFFDVFGKSSRSIIQYILDHPGEHFDVTPFIDRRCKHPIEEIQAAVDGAVSREQATKLKECLLHMDQLNEHREHIDAEILRLAEPYPYQLELLRTVPGFAAAPLTAVALISEIGVDGWVSHYRILSLNLNKNIHWYNHKCIKLSLGGLSPLEFRLNLGLAS